MPVPVLLLPFGEAILDVRTAPGTAPCASPQSQAGAAPRNIPGNIPKSHWAGQLWSCRIPQLPMDLFPHQLGFQPFDIPAKVTQNIPGFPAGFPSRGSNQSQKHHQVIPWPPHGNISIYSIPDPIHSLVWGGKGTFGMLKPCLALPAPGISCRTWKTTGKNSCTGALAHPSRNFRG